MQLGTRWSMGDEPPARLPDQVVAAIRDVEGSDSAPSPSRRWTLTWLEGRPIVELEPPIESDVYTTVSLNPEDQAAVVTFGD